MFPFSFAKVMFIHVLWKSKQPSQMLGRLRLMLQMSPAQLTFADPNPRWLCVLPNSSTVWPCVPSTRSRSQAVAALHTEWQQQQWHNTQSTFMWCSDLWPRHSKPLHSCSMKQNIWVVRSERQRSCSAFVLLWIQ